MPLLELPELAEWRERPVVTSGFRSLDRLLPRGCVARGSLVEWLADDEVSGATALAAAVAVGMATAAWETVGGTILVVDRGGRFYPPADALAGSGWGRWPTAAVHRGSAGPR